MATKGPRASSTNIEAPMSKTAYVLARLRQDLADGTIQPGQQLRQVEIAATYGVSPTPVREALRLLEADGAIQYSPHRGATVTELTFDELSDLYLLRRTVEALLSGLAARRADASHTARIRAMHEQLAIKAAKASESSAAALSKANRDFHLAILRLGSPLITQHVVEPLWHGFLPPSRSQWRSADRNALFVSEHEAIVVALEAGDEEAARSSMDAHLASAMRLREEAGQQKNQSR